MSRQRVIDLCVGRKATRLDLLHHQPSISGRQATHTSRMLLHLYTRCESSNTATIICAPLCDNVHRNGPHSPVLAAHKYSPGIFLFAQYCFLLIALTLSVALLMNTRNKNKSAHPGIPDMTPSQLASANLSRGPNTRRPPNMKKPTKDQQIAALKDELRAAQKLTSSVTILPHIFLDALTSFFSSRTALTSLQHTTTEPKWHRMQVVTLTLQPMPRRPR